MRIKFFLAWYDIWMGLYISRKDRKIYICPLPCCVIRISLPKKATYITAVDIRLFRKGEVIRLYKPLSPNGKATYSQTLKILRLYPKKNKLKIKEIT